MIALYRFRLDFPKINGIFCGGVPGRFDLRRIYGIQDVPHSCGTSTSARPHGPVQHV